MFHGSRSMTLTSAIAFSVACLAQTPAASLTQEFPVVMQQKLEAGKTPVGTKVTAKLVVATLVNGIVFPRNAVFTGEVAESAARAGNAPSRLSVRMHTLQAGDKTTNVETDLSGWIYPAAPIAAQNLAFQPPDEAKSPKNWNGGGAYPDPNNPVSQQKFPGRDSDRDTPQQAASPASAIAKHRVMIKGVKEVIDAKNHLTLTAATYNIKLDRLTTYVLTLASEPRQKQP
jgi:hypothetical protein